MTPEEEKALREAADSLNWSLRNMCEILSKRQMSADEWSILDRAGQTREKYRKEIEGPYNESRYRARQLAEAAALLATEQNPANVT